MSQDDQFSDDFSDDTGEVEEVDMSAPSAFEAALAANLSGRGDAPQDRDPAAATRADLTLAPLPESEEKIKLVLVPVYRGGKERTTENYLGSILYILILDPNWNPGYGTENLLNFGMHKRCYRKMARIDPYTTIKERVEMLSSTVDTTHAVRHLTSVAYKSACDMYISMGGCGPNYTGTAALRQFKSAAPRAVVESGNFHRYNNPYNPRCIFTVERALHYMERVHTVNLSSYCPTNMIYHGAGTERQRWRAWSFVESPQAAYLFHSTDFFWYHTSQVGLSGQLFPWVNDVYHEIRKIVRIALTLTHSLTHSHTHTLTHTHC